VKNRIIRLTMVASTAGLLAFGAGGVLSSAHAACPPQYNTGNPATTPGASSNPIPGGPVYVSGAGGVPTVGDPTGFAGVNAGAGFAELNSNGEPASTSIQDGRGYVTAQGSADGQTGGVVVGGTGSTVPSTSTC